MTRQGFKAKNFNWNIGILGMLSDIKFTKVSGKWAVTRKGDLKDGYKPFEFNAASNDVNIMSDFKTKKAAIEWVESNFSLDAIQIQTGITKIVWARNWKEAVEVSKFPHAYLST
ncbi:hypothetical protein [Pseudoalteromonas lipolytica]|uniref:hypothetical protein n=1 Tax=Pseudoalteromonas lipolytica TaxID=570156 RepID=UPI0030B08D76